jgi:Tfp pilus assembly protein PilF
MLWRWRGRVTSAPVTVALAAAQTDTGQAAERVRESAVFYLEAHRYADARTAALAWLQTDPQSSDAYAILAEAQEGEGNTTGAMDSYQTALALRPPSREEPRYLEERLSRLMRATRTMSNGR